MRKKLNYVAQPIAAAFSSWSPPARRKIAAGATLNLGGKHRVSILQEEDRNTTTSAGPPLLQRPFPIGRRADRAIFNFRRSSRTSCRSDGFTVFMMSIHTSAKCRRMHASQVHRGFLQTSLFECAVAQREILKTQCFLFPNRLKLADQCRDGQFDGHAACVEMVSGHPPVV